MVLGVTPKEALRGVADHLEFVLQRGVRGAWSACGALGFVLTISEATDPPLSDHIMHRPAPARTGNRTPPLMLLLLLLCTVPP